MFCLVPLLFLPALRPLPLPIRPPPSSPVVQRLPGPIQIKQSAKVAKAARPAVRLTKLVDVPFQTKPKDKDIGRPQQFTEHSVAEPSNAVTIGHTAHRTAAATIGTIAHRSINPIAPSYIYSTYYFTSFTRPTPIFIVVVIRGNVTIGIVCVASSAPTPMRVVAILCVPLEALVAFIGAKQSEEIEEEHLGAVAYL